MSSKVLFRALSNFINNFVFLKNNNKVVEPEIFNIFLSCSSEF